MKYQPHKLTEKQKRRCRQILHSLDNGDLTFGWGNTEEGIAYWVTAIDKLRAKIKHGTSDGKPWQEPEPVIPEGWRKAEPDEWKRTDVKCWWPPLEEWRLRTNQGTPFDNPIMRTHYIVPIDPPLTDQDARTRPWIMVKNSEEGQWQGPYAYMAKDERKQDLHRNRYLVRHRDGNFEWFCDARRATPEEIRQQLQ